MDTVKRKKGKRTWATRPSHPSVGAWFPTQLHGEAVTTDFEQVPRVLSIAVGRVGEELTFTYPEVLGVIDLCSANAIAVLGVELFLVKPDGHYASGTSDYDLLEKQRWPTVELVDWTEYVRYNNALAKECVHRNPLGDDHVYVLTTSSWREFSETQAPKRR